MAGLHLEIDTHMYTRGVWGHAPPDFRLSETASGTL